MSYELTTDITGEIGITPRLVRLNSTDDLATITTAGYLPNFSLYPTDIVFCSYETTNFALLNPVIADTGIITLELTTASAVDSVFGRTGVVVAAINDYSQAQINGLKVSDSPTFNNVNAGSSGTAGTFVAYPTTALKGSLKIAATDNTGDTQTVITNANMGQATTVSIPDPGAATAKFLLDSGAATMATGSKLNFDRGTGTEAANAVTINAQVGVITTSALTTAAGSSYAITLTNNKIATTNVVLISVMGGTNTTKAVTISATAGNGTSAISINNIDPAAALNGTLILGFAIL